MYISHYNVHCTLYMNMIIVEINLEVSLKGNLFGIGGKGEV